MTAFWGWVLPIVVRFVLSRRNETDRPKEPLVVVPVDPLESRVLDVVEAPPGSLSADDLGLVEADHRLGERVVVGVTSTADRGLDFGLSEPVGVADRQVLKSADALMFVKEWERRELDRLHGPRNA